MSPENPVQPQGPSIIEGQVVGVRPAAPTEQAYVTDSTTLRALDLAPGIPRTPVFDDNGIPRAARVSTAALDAMRGPASATGYDGSADLAPRSTAELRAVQIRGPLGAAASSGVGVRPPLDIV